MRNLFVGAIDIGGTNIMIGIVNSQGNVITNKKIDTSLNEGAPQKSLQEAVRILKKQCQKVGLEFSELAGIGVGCAGPVDIKRGTVKNPYTLPGWEEFNIVKYLNKISGLNIKLENDANVALLGEIVVNKISNENVLMVNFGTGIGVAAYVDGKIFGDENSYHPEMGHIVIDDVGDRCYCGQTGCFEERCSGTGLRKQANENGFKDFDLLFLASLEGNEKAKKCLKRIEKQIESGIWNLMIVFKPDLLILGGGVSSRYYGFFYKIASKFNSNREGFVNEFKIIRASTKNNSALIGARELILSFTNSI